MTDHPIINPNLLSHPADQELAIQGFKRAREIWTILQDSGLTIGAEEYFPGSNVTSDDDILDFIQRSLMTIYHASSTCKMGKPDDNMAVVDGKARVYGTQNLRVVDASAFPFLPSGHPQSAIYALAEKIAEDILGTAAPRAYGMDGFLLEEEEDLVRKGKGGNGGSSSETQDSGGSRVDVGLLSSRGMIMLWIIMVLGSVMLGVV
ncbi:MAG: hypothetical protein Q9216_003528 [Gyalolechia sp. 2 TL-2023]